MSRPLIEETWVFSKQAAGVGLPAMGTQAYKATSLNEDKEEEQPVAAAPKAVKPTGAQPSWELTKQEAEGLKKAWEAGRKSFDTSPEANKLTQSYEKELNAALQKNGGNFFSPDIASLSSKYYGLYRDSVYRNMEAGRKGRYAGRGAGYDDGRARAAELSWLDKQNDASYEFAPEFTRSPERQSMAAGWAGKLSEPTDLQSLFANSAIAGQKDGSPIQQYTYFQLMSAPDEVQRFRNDVVSGKVYPVVFLAANAERASEDKNRLVQKAMEMYKVSKADAERMLATPALNSVKEALRKELFDKNLSEYKNALAGGGMDWRNMYAQYMATGGDFVPVAFGNDAEKQSAFLWLNDTDRRFKDYEAVKNSLNTYSPSPDGYAATMNGIGAGDRLDQLGAWFTQNTGATSPRTAGVAYLAGNVERVAKSYEAAGDKDTADKLRRMASGIALGGRIGNRPRGWLERQAIKLGLSAGGEGRYTDDFVSSIGTKLATNPEFFQKLLYADPELLGVVLSRSPQIKFNNALDTLGAGNVILTQGALPLLAAADPTGISDSYAAKKREELFSTLGSMDGVDDIRKITMAGNFALPFLLGRVYGGIPLGSGAMSVAAPWALTGMNVANNVAFPSVLEGQRSTMGVKETPLSYHDASAASQLQQMDNYNSTGSAEIRWHLAGGGNDNLAARRLADTAFENLTPAYVEQLLQSVPEDKRKFLALALKERVLEDKAMAGYWNGIKNSPAVNGLQNILGFGDRVEYKTRQDAVENLQGDERLSSVLGVLDGYLPADDVMGMSNLTTGETEGLGEPYYSFSGKDPSTRPSPEQEAYNEANGEIPMPATGEAAGQQQKPTTSYPATPGGGDAGAKDGAAQKIKVDYVQLAKDLYNLNKNFPDIQKRVEAGDIDEGLLEQVKEMQSILNRLPPMDSLPGFIRKPLEEKMSSASSGFKKQLMLGVLKRPSLWHRGGELIFNELGMESVGAFVGENPWAFWLGLGGAGIAIIGLLEAMFGGGDEDDDNKGIDYRRLYELQAAQRGL